MSFCAAAMGACVVAIFWLFCARSWPKMALARLLVWLMNEEEKYHLFLYLRLVDCEAKNDSDGQSSHWTMVSGNQATSPTSPGWQSGQSPAQRQSCLHLRVTRRGSNGYQKRMKCEDCGLLLVEPVAEAGARAKKGRRHSNAK